MNKKKSKRKKKKTPVGRTVALGVGGVVGLGLIVWLAWDLAQPPSPPPPELANVETFDDLGVAHNDDPSVSVAYNSDPPTSGTHSSTPAACGIYRQSVPDGNQLHSMEHGAVVVQYDTSVSVEQIEILEEAGRSVGSDIIVAPRTGMPAPIVLTAWTKRLLLETASEDVVRAFAGEFGNRSPEGGALCPFQVDQGQ